MIKNFNIKFLPVILLLLLVFQIVDIKAVESYGVNNKYENVEIFNVKSSEKFPGKKGFLKRFFRKVSEKIKETKRKIVKKIKRRISKHNSRKNRMKGNLKERNRNLYNILLFSIIFVLIAGGILALFLYGIISSTIFLIISLVLGISAIVIALIYFSNRYIVKPHFRS